MREPKPHKPTVTRYQLPDGTRCAKGDAGARKVKTKSDTYYVWLGKGTARKRYSLETTDMGQAWVNLRKKQKELSDRERGITDDYSDHAARSLAEHVEDWLKSVADSGTESGQVRLMRGRVTELARLAGWGRLTDLSADSCLAALAKLQRDEWKQPKAGEEKGQRRGRSAQTRNHYLRHAKQFSRWCVPARLRADPLAALKTISVEADRRHDRRSPSDEEIDQLLLYLTTPPGKVYRGMSGPQRALGYKLAMATGYRAGELRSLSRESFDLDAGEVTVRASYSKRRRTDTQQLPPWLVEELRAWFAAGGGTWEGFPAQHPGQILKLDLEAAGVPYSTPGQEGPLFFDFHALRHWFVTFMANQPNLSLKTLLELTRHSNAELALKTYAKAKKQDVREAVDRLPPIGRPAPE